LRRDSSGPARATPGAPHRAPGAPQPREPEVPKSTVARRALLEEERHTHRILCFFLPNLCGERATEPEMLNETPRHRGGSTTLESISGGKGLTATPENACQATTACVEAALLRPSVPPRPQA